MAFVIAFAGIMIAMNPNINHGIWEILDGLIWTHLYHVQKINYRGTRERINNCNQIENSE